MNTHTTAKINTHTTVKGYAALSRGAPLLPFKFSPGPLGAEQVEIAVNYCGICHSDISMIDDAWSISAFPLVPGHEVVGTIAAAGSHVKYLHVGQRGRLGLAIGKLHGLPSIPVRRSQSFDALSPKSRLVPLGVVSEPIPVTVLPLIMYQRSITGSPAGSPGTLVTMLDFCAWHNIVPMTETFPLSPVNDALEHLRAGKARYRIVLKNDL
jgi:D-arabinose 1-dehydrogenase-like Zn-dependent alcohol dehydrogenase